MTLLEMGIEPSEADTTITLDFADAAKARDAFDRIEVWLHEVGIANDCTLAMSTAPVEPSDAEVEAAAKDFWAVREKQRALGTIPRGARRGGKGEGREFLKQTVIRGTELYDLYAACNWEPAEGQIGALIDAEIAREAESGGDE